MACDFLSLGLRRFLGAVPMLWMTPAPIRRRLKRNIELQGRHTGQRCFILANGPSLVKEDLALLGNELLISCNQGQILTESCNLAPRYHAFIDDIFLQDGYSGFLNEMVTLQERRSTTLLTSCQIAQEMRRRAPNIELFETHQFLISEYVARSMTRPPDLTVAQFGFHSVIHMAVTCALYMGFKEIYLLGCDMDYFVNPHETFKHSYGEGQFGAADKTAGELFGWGQIELMNWCIREFREFDELRRTAEAGGQRIVNAGRGGALHIFERESLDQIISRRGSARQ